MGEIRQVVVIGTGLMGTSVALALRRAGIGVWLRDRDPAALEQAVRLGAGLASDPGAPVDLAVLAVPPAAVAATLHDSQRDRIAEFYTDVASVKSSVFAAAAARGCDLATYVPGHPMAGGEKTGPAAARADLFDGRTWAICPTAAVRARAIAVVRRAAELTGAVPYEIGAEEHDRAAALVSHLPHLVSSVLAAQLTAADPAALRLTGAGVRDVTRVAAGDVRLWVDILCHNADRVAERIEAVVEDLQSAATELRAHAANPVEAPADRVTALAALLRRGNDGHRRLVAGQVA
ncbi:prephenate dehydrogenase [Micromonospora sp. NPDC048898]|uniref:prephenate dehydrogenase n=1 Tax=Micromonospora sp. NPDC048898 TaxID=3364260 RepID=UPI00371B0157